MAKGLMELPAEYQGPFEAEPVYSEAGDCVFFHLEEEEAYGDRVDGVLTVYRSFEECPRHDTGIGR